MDHFAERTLSLPLHPSLTDDDVAAVVAAVREGW
jgi:dTDP-4-amino-4,6-dideoxygalactose transaminase